MASFFWNASHDSKIHWKSWDSLCRHQKEGGLGFWRLRECNLALLAKKAWRIAMKTESVVYSVLSKRYFPSSNFFEARLGANPSYTWRSIWDAQEVLVAGLRWKVGDGCDISIIGHPWIPRPETFQPICQPLSLPADEKVGGSRDILVRHFEKGGVFSVCSAYRVACRLQYEASSTTPMRPWSFIWRAKVQPKFFSLVWACSDLPWKSLDCPCVGVEDWFRLVFGELGSQDWALFLTICWALWWRRNQWLFEGCCLDAMAVIRMARRSLCGQISVTFEEFGAHSLAPC
ncbi:UNVERIFIED_CONTAM: hypothetical protein Sradi_3596900 [Sesamum radiatum]|uniref:Reverse transcriptase zinc-binding domain-containing protein n=1 Tax=Sesamum radiatum TaxID=300843 RepID=A0AAW2QGW7_SESRA